MKIILGLVGEMAAGKTTVTEYLKEKYNAKSFRFSDMLRDVATRIHLDHTRENLQTLSTTLRQNFGDDIMSKVLAKDVAKAQHDFIITEGIRRPSDITYLREQPNFYIIALDVDERTRYERIIKRTENVDDQDKTWEQFQKEGQQESEQKIKEIAAEADFRIDNNGTLDDTYGQTEEILTRIAKS